MKTYKHFFENLERDNSISLFCSGAGNPEKQYVVNEEKIQHISHDTVFRDPNEKHDEGYSPEDMGFDDYHGTGHVNPKTNRKQSKHALSLYNHTVNKYGNDHDYENIISNYTHNSYNLNRTLYQHGHHEPIERNIKSHNDYDEHSDDYDEEPYEEDHGEKINIDKFDHLIHSNPLPHGITVYTGVHAHPAEFEGKIAHLHAYTSTSLSPHVAKDFGKPFGNNPEEKHILRIKVPKGHPHLFTDPKSLFPGQHEIILPRRTIIKINQEPTHTIKGNFESHFGGRRIKPMKIHIWDAKILKRKL